MLVQDHGETEFANIIAQLVQVRTAGNKPNAEYAIEVEFHLKGLCKAIADCHRALGLSGPFQLKAEKFPRYSIRDVNEANNLLNMFYQDFRDSLHILGQAVEFVIAVDDVVQLQSEQVELGLI